MKIAVPSVDGINISPHFGQSLCYLVFRVQGGEITGKEIRMLTEHRSQDWAQAQAREQTHIHAEILTPLLDCEAVLSGGMAYPVAKELENRGIKPFVVADPKQSPAEAVEKFLKGKLEFVEIHGECCQQIKSPEDGDKGKSLEDHRG
ncbi:MAG TPA: NifB/NifX family molybdenum-iron cluster-binding protein [bacterium]|nr:NifB/NifX family molybdenum-iron cluster-binding protein [bacterium]